MVAPKRKGRFSWKHNFRDPVKKRVKIPISLLRQIGGKINKKKVKRNKNKIKSKWRLFT